MPILDLHEDDMISAAQAAPAVPPRKQEPAFSAWGLLKAPARGVTAGAAEATGSTADILGAFGQISAAAGARSGGMFSSQTDAERRETAKQAKAIEQQGPDFRSEAGGLFRGVAKEYMPDPLTSHAAEVVTADFFRVAGKAVTAGLTVGPVAGAVVAGAEEGFTAADKLAEQGVDVGTRTAVGAVTGAVTALGFALPVAGKTVGKTVGLALAGGPASFVAQQAATREILQNADYSKLADQYDPFDPVGLTLSTLVPLGFGAAAMRGAASRAAGGKPVPEVAPAPPEVVDAARVQLLRETSDAARVTPPEDFAGAQAHDAAVGKALEQLAGGQRVEVPDLPEPVALQITEALAPKLEAARAELDAVLPRADAPAAPEVPPMAPIAPEAPARFDIDTLARQAGELLSDGRSPAEIIGRMQASGQAIAPELQNMLVGAGEFVRRMPELIDQFRALEASNKGAPVQNLIADAVERMRAGQPPDAGPVPANALQARLDAEIVGNPSALDTKMPTAFDLDGKVSESVTVREFLDAVKAEADQEAADANLLQVAANCLLTSGA